MNNKNKKRRNDPFKDFSEKKISTIGAPKNSSLIVSSSYDDADLNAFVNSADPFKQGIENDGILIKGSWKAQSDSVVSIGQTIETDFSSFNDQTIDRHKLIRTSSVDYDVSLYNRDDNATIKLSEKPVKGVAMTGNEVNSDTSDIIVNFQSSLERSALPFEDKVNYEIKAISHNAPAFLDKEIYDNKFKNVSGSAEMLAALRKMSYSDGEDYQLRDTRPSPTGDNWFDVEFHNDSYSFSGLRDVTLRSIKLPGSTGATGIVGLTGETGIQGYKGASGGQGINGDNGVQGSIGNTGPKGSPGVSGGGSIGATGIRPLRKQKNHYILVNAAGNIVSGSQGGVDMMAVTKVSTGIYEVTFTTNGSNFDESENYCSSVYDSPDYNSWSYIVTPYTNNSAINPIAPCIHVRFIQIVTDTPSPSPSSYFNDPGSPTKLSVIINDALTKDFKDYDFVLTLLLDAGQT